jgi:hypothetical protein
VQHPVHPLSVVWSNDDNLESVFFAFNPDAFRIIDMQVDPEGGRILARRTALRGSP